MSCHHPSAQRAPVEGSKTHYLCGKCGEQVKIYKRPDIRHGTDSGYDKHRRERKGHWNWPACTRCVEAHREYLRGYQGGDDQRDKARQRSIARQRALQRLQHLHPGEYAKLYNEELDLMRTGGSSAIATLEGEIKELLAGHRSNGVFRDPWADLRKAIKDNCATTTERTMYRRIMTLQYRIAQERERAEKAEVPGGDRQ